MLHAGARFVSFLISLLVLCVVVSFVLSNREPVNLALFPLPYALSAPPYVMALLLLAIGWISGYSIGHFAKSKMHTALKREHQRTALLEDEIKSLRLQQQATGAPISVSSTIRAS